MSQRMSFFRHLELPRRDKTRYRQRLMAYGRNGWFCLTRLSVSLIECPEWLPQESHFVRIDGSSERAANSEPLILECTHGADLRWLAERCLEAADALEALQRTGTPEASPTEGDA